MSTYFMIQSIPITGTGKTNQQGIKADQAEGNFLVQRK